MLSENHKRYLLNALRHIDRLLTEATAKLRAPNDRRLFPEYVADATPAQQKALHDYLDSMRFVLERIMQRHGLVGPPPSVSLLWAFHTSLTFARIAVEELRPEYMRGYGDLSAEDEEEILRFIAELHLGLRRIADYLYSGDGGDLSGRLARLENTRDEVRLLREIEAIVDRHGLVEFRSWLADLTARLESARYEIAFFGPVSAGKSSLLNTLLGMAVLPVGVTPVTSVVTRLRHGDVPRLQVSFAAAPAVEAPLDRIVEFVTEDLNPANCKHVLDVNAEVPVDLLRNGLNLIDTPGLGSLAAVGAAQTLAYLPRCDLAVMLVDATGRLGHGDMAVARSVIEAGTELMLVLSKADLIDDKDRQTQIRYVQKQFRDALGIDVAVTPVSAAANHAALTTHWIEAELAPRIERLRELMDASLRRKIGVLRESVVASLSVHAGSDEPGTMGQESGEAGNRLAQLRTDILAMQHDVNDVCFALIGHTDLLLERAADDALRTSASGENCLAEAAVQLIRSLSSIADALYERLDTLRRSAEEAVRFVNGRAGTEQASLPRPAGCPSVDPTVFGTRDSTAIPRWTLRIPAIEKQWLRQELRRRWGAALADTLSAYSTALRKWSAGYLDELTRECDSQTAAFESRLRAGKSADEPMDTEALEQDIARLRDRESAD
jgi:GTP-binding protein EngB required for normal cell division